MALHLSTTTSIAPVELVNLAREVILSDDLDLPDDANIAIAFLVYIVTKAVLGGGYKDDTMEAHLERVCGYVIDGLSLGTSGIDEVKAALTMLIQDAQAQYSKARYDELEEDYGEAFDEYFGLVGECLFVFYKAKGTIPTSISAALASADEHDSDLLDLAP